MTLEGSRDWGVIRREVSHVFGSWVRRVDRARYKQVPTVIQYHQGQICGNWNESKPQVFQLLGIRLSWKIDQRGYFEPCSSHKAYFYSGLSKIHNLNSQPITVTLNFIVNLTVSDNFDLKRWSVFLG